MGDKVQPYHQDNLITIYNKDCRDMSEIPDGTIQCVVTSPPYWGLRKYKGNQDLVWGGTDHCQHEWGNKIPVIGTEHRGNTGLRSSVGNLTTTMKNQGTSGNFCSLCGAWRGAYGLEPTPELYCQHTIEILREIRRVLRKDGVVFWNIGDSYYGGGFGHEKDLTAEDFAKKYPKQGSNRGTDMGWEERKQIGDTKRGKHLVLKSKDLCLIPFRVAIACQEDGWWVRSVIIWNKTNPMPESVTDRPTESHEYILMLTKSAHYYYDQEAVREPNLPQSISRSQYPMGAYGSASGDTEQRSPSKKSKITVKIDLNPSGRNLRSVWTFSTQPYPEAHFATFPEALPERCIKAATPEVGCCSKCGAPWERIIERGELVPDEPQYKPRGNKRGDEFVKNAMTPAGETQGHPNFHYEKSTLGWQPTCKCNADKMPATVLDPFMGSGTTLWVAKKLGRKAIGYELSEEYCQLALERNRQMALVDNG